MVGSSVYGLGVFVSCMDISHLDLQPLRTLTQCNDMEINALLPEYEAVLDPDYVQAYKANVGTDGMAHGGQLS